MKILMFGSSGFVSQHMKILVKSNTNWEIFESDIKPSNNKNYFQCDITNKNDVDKVISLVEPDYLINFAAQSSVKISWENPGLTMNINTIGTINILESIRKCMLKTRILLIGSVEEYGDLIAETVDETHSLNPKNIYAISKVAQELIAKTYIEAYNMQIVFARSSNHFGPGQDKKFVISDFSYQIANIVKHNNSKSHIKTGNINIKKDFSDVRDVVKAYLLLLMNGKVGEAYNVASGEAVSIKSLLEKLILLSGKDISVEVDENKFRPAEVLNCNYSIIKIEDYLGWSREYSIEDTLRDTFEYWLKSI